MRAAGAVLLTSWSLVLASCGGGKHPEPPQPARPTILQDDAELLYAPADRVRPGMARARSLGVDWVRLTAGWSHIAPEPRAVRAPRFDAADPAAYPQRGWAPLDQAVRAAQAEGMQVMIDIGFWAPRWATTRTVAPSPRQRWEVDPRHFARFAEAVARRYSGGYRGLPRAVAFAVWNEPNNGDFLLPQWRRSGERWEVESARVYRAMVEASVPAIRRAAPGSLVLIGGTFQAGFRRPKNETSAVPPLHFLRELACVDAAYRPRRDGDCASFRALPGDGWAHHPYAPITPPAKSDPAPDNVRIADLDRLTAALARLHRTGRTQWPLDVWVTEFGYETNPPDPTQRFSPADQVRFLAQAEYLAWRNRDVRSWAQFLLRDLNPDPGGSLKRRWSTFQTGLEFVDGRLKPAGQAFRHTLLVLPEGSRRMMAWGHVRPGRGARDFRISALQRPAGWRPVLDAETDADGYFVRTILAPRHRPLRLEVRDGDGWRAGPAVTADSPAAG